MRESGFCCDTDTDDSNTMNKKVRNAQLAQYNFIFGEIFECSFFLRDKEVFQFEFFSFQSCGREGEDQRHRQRAHQGQQGILINFDLAITNEISHTIVELLNFELI